MNIWDGNKERAMRAKDYEFEHFEQAFIDTLKERNDIVQVHLLGGTRLIGRIIGSDDHTILISRPKSNDQMIYKTAITTISIFEDKSNG